MIDKRIYSDKNLNTKRGEEIKINFEGKNYKAFTSESLAVSLFANDIRILARSLKYHRPRGMFCTENRCSSCILRVNGIPNVPTCQVMAQDMMTIENQNAFPDLGHDVFSNFNMIFKHGMHHQEMFTASKITNKLFMQLVRSFSGAGMIPDKNGADKKITIKNKYYDVVVVGSGISGLIAAITASAEGHKICLLEEKPQLGGKLRFSYRFPFLIENFTDIDELYKDLLQKLKRKNNIDVFTGSTAIGYYREGKILVKRENDLLNITPKKLILATGSYDTPMIFKNNDAPGIISRRAAEKLVNLFGVKPGEKMVYYVLNREDIHFVRKMCDLGLKVSAIMGTKRVLEQESSSVLKLQNNQVAVYDDFVPDQALGKGKINKLSIINHKNDQMLKIDCDTIIASKIPQPSFELAHQAGCKTIYDNYNYIFKPLIDATGRTNVENILAAGEITGETDLCTIYSQGKNSGLQVLYELTGKTQYLTLLNNEIKMSEI